MFHNPDDSADGGSDSSDGDSVWLGRLLRGVGWFSLSAFAAAVMPAEWMIKIADALGLTLPNDVLAIYLARHLSLLYGCVAVGLILVGRDVVRYRPLLPWIAAGVIAFGIGQAFIDWQSGMPLWWTAGESLSTIGGGGLIAWLLRRLPP